MSKRDEIRAALEENARYNQRVSNAEACSKNRAILEEADKDNYYKVMYGRNTGIGDFYKYQQHVYDAIVTEALNCLVNSCIDSVILKEEYNQNLSRQLCTNFVREKGAMNLLREWKSTSYLMSEISYICENNIKSILEKADKKSPATLKIKDQDKKQFFKDLDKANTDAAVTAIRSKVKNAVQEFIDANNTTKDQIKSVLDSTKKKMEKSNGKDENLKEAWAALGKRKVTDARNNRITSVFEGMVYSLSQAAMTNADAKQVFCENASLNMDRIVEHCEVMYTFLEALNTCKIIKPDEEFIKSIIVDLRG